MNSLLDRISRLPPRSLQLKLSLLVTILLVVLVCLIGVLFSDSVSRILRQEIGRNALALAQTMALNPVVREGLEAKDSLRVQHVAEKVRLATKSSYVVVADREGTRYSHPNPEKIGKQFVGGDFHPAVEEGKSYVSQAVGTLGPSLRGFVPVRGNGGDIIGFVAVGYPLSEIQADVYARQMRILNYVAAVLLFGVLGAVAIARMFKAAIFDLEPHEIAALFQERDAIIKSIREAVVAVDRIGQVTMVNDAGRRYLGLDLDEDVRGRCLRDICACEDMEKALAAEERVLDTEMSVAGRLMIVNVIPLGVDGGSSGAVASFRPRDELDRLESELLHMQEYSELLRAQTHEYSNKLHTIAGLIQIGAQQEALEFIMMEASGHQELVRTLAEAIPDPVVSGIILGKFHRARELKIMFVLDPESSFGDLPPHIDRGHLVTIIGNLLDNAFEAVLESDARREVRLFLTNLGLDLVIEVEDSGRGIPTEIADRLFVRGVTTRDSAGRGVGLYLVKRALEALGGSVACTTGELGGALFTSVIPKSRTDETV